MATKRQFCVCLYGTIIVLIVIATLNLFVIKFTEIPKKGTMVGKLVSVDFEVFGRVQGVFFRKHTQQQGEKLKLVGWCMNTSRDTVVGSLQGDEDSVKQMKDWLQHKGSPSSKIDKAVFKNEKDIEKLSFSKFDIRR